MGMEMRKTKERKAKFSERNGLGVGPMTSQSLITKKKKKITKI